MTARPSHIGAHVTRVEDDRLLEGRARFVADVSLPGMLEAVFYRSPLPHALIEGVDAVEAMQVPGVAGAFTAQDMTDVLPFPDFDPRARPVAIFPLARDKVRYVGAPIAVVVAPDRYEAEDARDLLTVNLEPLDPVVSVDEALADGAPLLYPEWPDNTVIKFAVTKPEAIAEFETNTIVSGRYEVGRHAGVPMETRGVAAEYRDGRLTVWTSTQFPHIARTMLSYCLPMDETDIRVIAPDVGGGFGVKAEFYPEEVTIPWLAMKLGRPVRWIEDRREHLIAACHARDLTLDLQVAVDDEGRFRAVRGMAIQDLGAAEMYPYGFSPAFTAISHITGPYRIPHQSVGVIAVATNKTPSGAYRGFGIPEAVFAIERLMDKAADRLGIHRSEIRRRNLLGQDDLPYTTSAGAIINSGSHRDAFEETVRVTSERLDLWRSRLGHDPQLRLGSGVVNYIEGVTPTYYFTSGHWTSFDSCSIRMNPDGTALVSVGVSTSGQGLESMLTSLTAEALGVARDQVRVVMGDTDRTPYGLGSWGSRSTNVASGALREASNILLEKATRIAGHLMEASPDDIEVHDGHFSVRGTPGASVTWQEVATVANIRTMDLPEGVKPGLEATASYDPPGIEHDPDEYGRVNGCATYTNASHGVVLSVDTGTGKVRVLEYIVAHDCGTVINPQIVRGQVVGGIAQGIGGALLEKFHYDEWGNPLSTSFLDYHLPTAREIPNMVVRHFQSPDPTMPWGAKGAGEAGIIGPAPAIAAAIEEALPDPGVAEITRTPITAPHVLGMVLSSGSKRRPRHQENAR
jgi:carbon-monoxide dehydrogenase large subunit